MTTDATILTAHPGRGLVLNVQPPMQRFVFRYLDGRKVEFTAFSLTVASDWAAEQGTVESWSSVVDDDSPVTAPVWTDR